MSQDDKFQPVDLFEVLINDEEQHCIWPAYKDLPQGWRKKGKQGTKDECIDIVDKEWTDMRPMSLRIKMENNIN